MKNGCSGSGPVMDQRTMHLRLYFPTNLVFWGICILLPCNLVGLGGSDSNCRGRGRPCKLSYWG
jgi:hypothetical protein